MKTSVQDTSIESFHQHRPKIQPEQQRIMLFIHGNFPCRDFSLQEISRGTSIAVHVVSARVNELVNKLGYLERGERRKCKVTGRMIRGIRVRLSSLI